jgi:DNA-binding winged helix-turn-helix (wHTH) protein/tetratricopeptide (TPR) repeat protein
VPLRPKVFHVLAYLLTHRDRIVAKQELAEQLWPGQFISDETLSTCITAVRQAVGDSGEGQQIIQTRRGLGYRFVAHVICLDGAPENAHVSAPPEGPPASSARALQSSDVLECPRPIEEERIRVRERARHAALDVPAVGEYKAVTVLAGTLSYEVMPEAETWHHLRRVLFGLLQEVLASFGGTLHRSLDDGFVALFGAPLAQEDHALRALHAARAMQQRVAQADIALPGAAHLGLGVHTGRVVVDSLGDQSQLFYTPLDHAVEIAVGLSRLEGETDLVVSTATRARLASGMQYGPARALVVPAVPTVVTAYPVLGGQASGVSLVRRAGRLSPFVGRQRELGGLQAALRQVQAGQGQVVGIVGDPGMGKTRLLYEFQRQAQRAGLRWLTGHGVSYGSSTPYGPILALLSQVFGLDAAEAPRQQVQQAVEQSEVVTADEVAYLVALWHEQTPEAALAAVPPQVRRARTFAAIEQVWWRLSQRQPLILALENLHWIDPTSEELVRRLVERLAGVPILLLLTYRPGYRPAWMDRSYATQLALAPLAPADSRRLLRTLTHGIEVSEPHLETILARAEGNPFFLEELALAVQTLDGGEPQTSVPASIQAVLAARMDRLPPATKAVLQVAAVIGREIPLWLLQAVAVSPSEALQHHLQHLQSAELLTATRPGVESIYAFKHALTQEVAYQSLLKSSRQPVHARVARACLEHMPHAVDRQPEWLAYHYTEAGLIEQALPYWQRAGEQASGRSAFTEAMSHFGKYLHLLQSLPETSERLQRELELNISIGGLYVASTSHADPGVQRFFSRAYILCKQLGATERLPRILVGLWAYYHNQAEYRTARHLMDELFAVAEQQHHPDNSLWRLWGHTLMGQTVRALGEITLARHHFEQGVEVYGAGQYHPRLQSVQDNPTQDFGVICQGNLGRTLFILGYPDQALAHSRHTRAVAERSSQPFTRITALAQ